jgi:hypothetical protein
MQLNLNFGGPWSGYGYITVRGVRLYALVYHTWDRWFAQALWNRGLKRDLHGVIADVQEFGEMDQALSVRAG